MHRWFADPARISVVVRYMETKEGGRKPPSSVFPDSGYLMRS